MSLSEKIKNTRFAKSMAGYSSKEVDAFIDDILPQISEFEQQISVLRVKLDALEFRSDEISKRENEAERLLDAAKKEAEKIVSAAKERAAGIVAAGEKTAAEKMAAAEKNAVAIVSAADKKGSEIVAAAEKKSGEINEKVAALVGEYEAFEAQFRKTVADTVKNFSAIRESAPKAAAPKPLKKEATKPKVQAESNEARDYEFVGGKRADTVSKAEEKSSRKLYDTVTVTYDTDDGYADIKKLKDSAQKKEIKNPTEF